MRAALVRASLLAAVLLLSASVLPAQQWNVDAQAGRLRSALDPHAPQSQAVLLGLRYDDAHSGLRLTGGVPTTTGEPLWGSVAGAKRLVIERSGFVAGVDLAGNAFVLHDRVTRTREIPGLFGSQLAPGTSLSGNAFAGQVLPVVGFEGAQFQLHARAGVSQYTGQFAGQQRDRRVSLADLEGMIAATSSFAVMPALRYYHAPEADYTYAGATAIVSSGAASVWATAGQWLNRADENTPWAAGASLRVHERVTLNGSVRRDAVDPLYLSPPQTAWNAGVSLLIGRAPSRAAPVPAKYENGRATIRLPASQSSTPPSVAGDFNDWKPAPMQRAGNDWVFTTTLTPGVYNFSFVSQSGDWFVPEKYPGRKDDGMGGHVAVLVVS